MPRRGSAVRPFGAMLTGLGLIGAVMLTMLAQAVAGGGVALPVPAGPAALGHLRALDRFATAPPATLHRALAAAPLAWEPFHAAGIARLPRADAQVLFDEALRRDPHALPPHLALLALAAQRGDIDRVMAHLAAIRRLDSALGDDLLGRLGARADSAEAIAQAADGLAHHPDLLAPFLTGFAGARHPAALVLALADRLPRAALADPQARAALIADLVRTGAYARARALWQSALPPGAAPGDPVFSPDFADLAAPPPFGWLLHGGDAGVAERDPAGGIAVRAYGRAAGPLVEQWVTLGPGRYRLILAGGRGEGAAGALRVQVHCAADNGLIADRALAADGTALVEFAVPGEGCAAQVVAVSAVAADGGQSVVLRRLTITRIAP